MRRAGTATARIVVAAAVTLVVAAGCTSVSSSQGGPAAPSGIEVSAPGPGTAGRSGTVPSSCNPARPSSTAPDAEQHLVSGGVDRVYQIALPPSYDGTTPTPLILNWHGSGSGMTQQVFYSQLPAKGPAQGFIVVTPDGTGTPRGWNMFRRSGEADDFAFADDLVDDLSDRLCLDTDRLYSTGISNGSAFTDILACTPPYRFAAIALVATTVGPACPPAVKVSVIAFHGTADPVVPYGGGSVNAVASGGVKAPGAEDAIARWAAHDGCATTPQVTTVGSDVQEQSFPGCDPGLAVTFYRIEGGGHTWPGSLDLGRVGLTLGATTQQINAADTMLAFFRDHPKAS